MFTQVGLPRSVAEQNQLPYARFIQPDSPMWMGFSDQQVNAAGPPEICTFAGHPSARLSTARPGDYLDNGGIQHLSHVILDMLQFYDMAAPGTPPSENGNFTKRVQYMFHAPPVHPGNPDQLTDGGGPSFLPAENRGPEYAERTARGIGLPPGERRMGHLSTLQRSSRASDGTPMHLRVDGPGFDPMDVPDGSSQPKLHFSVFVPTADFFDPDAAQPGLGGPGAQASGGRAGQRPGALPDLHPSAELPGAAASAPGLSARRAGRPVALFGLGGVRRAGRRHGSAAVAVPARRDLQRGGRGVSGSADGGGGSAAAAGHPLPDVGAVEARVVAGHVDPGQVTGELVAVPDDVVVQGDQ